MESERNYCLKGMNRALKTLKAAEVLGDCIKAAVAHNDFNNYVKMLKNSETMQANRQRETRYVH